MHRTDLPVTLLAGVSKFLFSAIASAVVEEPYPVIVRTPLQTRSRKRKPITLMSYGSRNATMVS